MTVSELTALLNKLRPLASDKMTVDVPPPRATRFRHAARFIDTGIIRYTREIAEDQIQPASIDLRLWHEAYRVRASFLPGKSTTLIHKATANGMLDRKIEISDPTLLEPNVVYIIPLMESLALPPDIYGIANPKVRQAV